ncbi:MAG: hypothetical protein H0T43_09435 [Solirubrobacterales bacterium]|nr:hypothetical protein [Solirubrobacterales bacterium]
MTTAYIFAGGSWIFLGFIVFMFFAIVQGYYTRAGSGINHRPYRKPYGDAPGADIPNTLGRDIARQSSRGTR